VVKKDRGLPDRGIQAGIAVRPPLPPSPPREKGWGERGRGEWGGGRDSYSVIICILQKLYLCFILVVSEERREYKKCCSLPFS